MFSRRQRTAAEVLKELDLADFVESFDGEGFKLEADLAGLSKDEARESCLKMKMKMGHTIRFCRWVEEASRTARRAANADKNGGYALDGGQEELKSMICSLGTEIRSIRSGLDELIGVVKEQQFQLEKDLLHKAAGGNPLSSGPGPVRSMSLSRATSSVYRPPSPSAMPPAQQQEMSALCRLGAERGDARSQFQLGTGYLYGRGLDQSFEEALIWLRKAADQGHSKAQYSVGNIFFHGRGVETSEEEAFNWYRKAAMQGHAKAQFMTGSCLENGKGAEQDLAEASKWYRKSAEQGIVDAQHKLALLYKEGRGVPRTGGEAAWWFLKAADQGHAGAASNLGEMYKLASTRAPPPLSQDLQPKRSNSP